jgi:hypothetical protein
MVITMMMLRLCARQDALDFGDRNHWNELCEEQEERQENAERADEDGDFNPRW